MARVPVTSNVWTKVASAGSVVVIDNSSVWVVYIMTAVAAPDPADKGIPLTYRDEPFPLSLTQDLWARAAADPLTLIVMSGISLGSSSSGTTPASTPGGGPNNTADMSDPNNAYLANVGG